MILCHLMDGSIRSLNRQFHQVFIVRPRHLMTKRFIEHLDRGLRSHFARFRSPYAVSNCKDAAIGVGEKRVFVERTFCAQSSIRYSRGFERNFPRLTYGLVHWTASSFNDERLGAG